ncbi:MAG: serine/threonine-protein phosphatase [Nitrosomonadales bacterium]|nr:serine/threonine-protein phosphatase [Nitrosomonadales bacterium]
MKFGVYQASRIGGRKYNQDRAGYAYTDAALLLVLADGMGGHLHGEVAAQIAVQTFMDAFKLAAQPRIAQPEAFLRDILRQAHDEIVRYAQQQHLGGNPGTTCAVALVQDGQAYWAHAGDSRCYLLRDGEAAAVTHDHSVVQQWADWGIIGADEMKTHPDRNKITNCLGGVGDAFYPDSTPPLALLQGDVLLLCSDGLWSPLVDGELATGFRSAVLSEMLEQMMDRAVGREGARADNTTAVVARIGDTENEQPAAEPVCVVLDLSGEESLSTVLGRTRTDIQGFNSA